MDPIKNYELAILELRSSFDGQMDEKVIASKTLGYVKGKGHNPLSNYFWILSNTRLKKLSVLAAGLGYKNDSLKKLHLYLEMH